jgi:glutaredoxin
MKQVILYSMQGCPWCDKMKEALNEGKISYRDRDIDVYKKEYDMFVEATGNDYVPAFMLLDIKDDEVKEVKMMAPERDYDDIPEAIEKVKNFL